MIILFSLWEVQFGCGWVWWYADDVVAPSLPLIALRMRVTQRI